MVIPRIYQVSSDYPLVIKCNYWKSQSSMGKLTISTRPWLRVRKLQPSLPASIAKTSTKNSSRKSIRTPGHPLKIIQKIHPNSPGPLGPEKQTPRVPRAPTWGPPASCNFSSRSLTTSGNWRCLGRFLMELSWEIGNHGKNMGKTGDHSWKIQVKQKHHGEIWWNHANI